MASQRGNGSSQVPAHEVVKPPLSINELPWPPQAYRADNDELNIRDIKGLPFRDAALKSAAPTRYKKQPAPMDVPKK